MSAHHWDKASGLLLHYMRYAWQEAGLAWDHDHTAEIETIIDHITLAVRAEIDAGIRQHLDDHPHANLPGV